MLNSKLSTFNKKPTQFCVGFFCNFAFMTVILFDINRENYYPLTDIRPVSDFMIGILTSNEKWDIRILENNC